MNTAGLKKISVIVLCLLLFAAAFIFAAKYYFTASDYNTLRASLFTRAYESLVSQLGDYYNKEDPASAGNISYSLSYLPLTAREEDTATLFLSDINSGGGDENARERAKSYCGELLKYLVSARSEKYKSGWKAKALGIPDYPEFEKLKAADAAPADDKETESKEPLLSPEEAKKKALELLGVNIKLTGYSYNINKTKIYGFSCSNAYIEYREDTGALFKALISRKRGSSALEYGEIELRAKNLLRENGYGDLKLVSHDYSEGAVIFIFEGEAGEVMAALATSNALLCAFSAEEYHE